MRKLVLNALLLMLFPMMTWAHEIRPAYLEIKEAADHSLQITWKQPVMGEMSVPLHPSISTGWMADSLARLSYTETYLIKRWKVTAKHVTLDKQQIRIKGLENTMTDVLVQITLLQGHSYTYIVKPIQPYIQLSLSSTPPPPVWQYLRLGIYHIWSGFDHLLFVFGLLLLVRKRSRLIWTITAFTIAHSITLALATLHIVKVSGAFTESAIALSIVFLAVELLRHYNGKNGLTYQYPWMVSFMFGLLHGLGFASALQDIGLPDNNLPLALFLFNAGVEMGQLAFVFLMLPVLSVSMRLSLKFPNWISKTPAYFIGTLAVYWFIDRVVAIL